MAKVVNVSRQITPRGCVIQPDKSVILQTAKLQYNGHQVYYVEEDRGLGLKKYVYKFFLGRETWCIQTLNTAQAIYDDATRELIFDGVNNYYNLSRTLDLGTYHQAIAVFSSNSVGYTGVQFGGLGSYIINVNMTAKRFYYNTGAEAKYVDVPFINTTDTFEYKVIRNNLELKFFVNKILVGTNFLTTNTPISITHFGQRGVGDLRFKGRLKSFKML